MFVHWSLSDSKSPQVSRTRLRILAVLSNAVIWIVSTRPPTSKSSRPFNNPSVIVPNTPITIGAIVTFMFRSFFISLARSRYLSFFSLSFRFILWSAGTAKSIILQILFFFFFFFVDYYKSGLLTLISWSVYMLKSHRSLCESFSRTGAGLWLSSFSPFRVFHTSVSRWFSHRSLSDCKSSQVSRNFGLVWFGSVWSGLVSLFNGISTFVGYLMPKPFS